MIFSFKIQSQVLLPIINELFSQVFLVAPAIDGSGNHRPGEVTAIDQRWDGVATGYKTQLMGLGIAK
jgi:hypothetical protein